MAINISAIPSEIMSFSCVHYLVGGLIACDIPIMPLCVNVPSFFLKKRFKLLRWSTVKLSGSTVISFGMNSGNGVDSEKSSDGNRFSTHFLMCAQQGTLISAANTSIYLCTV